MGDYSLIILLMAASATASDLPFTPNLLKMWELCPVCGYTPGPVAAAPCRGDGPAGDDAGAVDRWAGRHRRRSDAGDGRGRWAKDRGRRWGYGCASVGVAWACGEPPRPPAACFSDYPGMFRIQSITIATSCQIDAAVCAADWGAIVPQGPAV